uniref:Senescence regulator n=2 Tax=Cucumis sativus TaxID=3659 RepID=A0A0A0LAY5_CUCSA
MDLYTAASLLSHSSPSSHHFLHFSSSPPSHTPPALSPSDEFNESELFWTADFVQSSNNSSRSRKISTDDRASSFIPPPNSGILAALSDDFNYDRKKRIGTILTRDTTSITKSPSSSTRSIPRPVQSNREYSQSVPCRKFQQSAPIKVPEAMRKGRNDRDHVERKEEEEEEEEQMLPPHEIVRRGSGMSPNTTFSVLEGAGRTLKGRDLRRVRNAVWHRTGFVD